MKSRRSVLKVSFLNPDRETFFAELSLAFPLKIELHKLKFLQGCTVFLYSEAANILLRGLNCKNKRDDNSCLSTQRVSRIDVSVPVWTNV